MKFPIKNIKANIDWKGPIMQDFSCEPRMHLHYHSIDDFINHYKSIHPSHRMMMELIRNHKQRMRIDMDFKPKSTYTKDTWKELICQVCTLLKSQKILVFNMSDSFKWSTHLVVVDKWMNTADECLNLFEDIVSQLTNDNDKQALDKSVYKHVQYFRIEGSSKDIIGNRRKKLTSIWDGKELQSSKSLSIKVSTLISHPNYLESYVEPPKVIPIRTSISNHPIITEVPLGFKVRKVVDNLIILDRVIPSWCTICKRVHDNEGAFMYNEQFYCRRYLPSSS